MTAYDLKKTLAVLLDNILQRIGKLESKVENLVINGTGANSTNSTTTAIPSSGAAEKLNVADLINGAQEQCELPPMDGFPHCEGKIKWMKDMWRSDPCYASYGVDGSTCSFFIYLSEGKRGEKGGGGKGEKERDLVLQKQREKKGRKKNLGSIGAGSVHFLGCPGRGRVGGKKRYAQFPLGASRSWAGVWQRKSAEGRCGGPEAKGVRWV
ncbi:alpha-C6-mannosylglycoprotein 6-beta-N-acetylglucosaminyltransferase A-like [Crotalus adamanteus]|uniref:Alpha-C6-mannosylglycoprotein 6-beta-N-acetylglucosaminyltransferase A-like n=1 Tax=Crotalus adamanteus TaxID=8729 RepID=A0AAW1C8C0_CROAD